MLLMIVVFTCHDAMDDVRCIVVRVLYGNNG